MEAAGWLNTPGALEEVADNYARAGAAGVPATCDYMIAEARVSLRFASGVLRERVTPAFAHLATPVGGSLGPASLTVNLWDSATTGIEPPRLPPTPAAEAIGSLYHFSAPPLRAAYQPRLGTLSILNLESAEAWHWVRNASDESPWDKASPLRQLLFWWLGSRGYLQLHAAAVGTATGGVLLIGRPGSGKSTVALACLGSDLLYAGDDYVGATVEPRPRVASLYSSAKINPEHVATLTHLRPLLADAPPIDEDKVLAYVHAHFPERTTAGFPLEALVVPSFDSARRTTQTVELSRAAAFAALAPTTMVQLHTAGREQLSLMSTLVARLPCYGLEFGHDLGAIPGEIATLISKLCSARDA